ncbi:PTS system, Lactose/Cellobiose specific IIA subunit [Lactobacillus paragasseri JV-V03]|uniref:PTS system, Lactose/Cellobiose specific IIA subunit n=1 Tax=Lactobacillus paragasseri JV-V03 TaxID=525326 RepID=A0AA87DCW2_9LACO|nr:PTS lactose/cellobiose transporter subunit IIA [Lactobacillus paragasseri]EFJ69151.1 PTS system, Lactose/Cellobiose specific IIA subunit [Lactobacillus paragasseri JV-V03]
MDVVNTKSEDIAMSIIANSGDGRSKAFNALSEAEKGNFEKAEKLISESSDAIGKAHDVQTQMLVDEANGKKTEFSILTIHAQDHFMTSMLANELIKHMIDMQKEINQLKGEK